MDSSIALRRASQVDVGIALSKIERQRVLTDVNRSLETLEPNLRASADDIQLFQGTPERNRIILVRSTKWPYRGIASVAEDGSIERWMVPLRPYDGEEDHEPESGGQLSLAIRYAVDVDGDGFEEWLVVDEQRSLADDLTVWLLDPNDPAAGNLMLHQEGSF